MMYQAKSVCFLLFLFSVAVPQVVLSTRVNKTVEDGKAIFITGDNNEVVVSRARETKIALAEIKTKLQSLSKKDDEFTGKLQVLDEKILSRGQLDAMNKTVQNCTRKITSLDGKLDLVNKSNAELSLQIQAMSQKLQTSLDKQAGKLDSMNKTITTLSKTVDSMDERTEKKLDLLNQSNVAMSVQIQALSQRVTKLENQASAYALKYPRKGTSDYVITRGMPSLKAVTACLWMKTTDTGFDGTPLSYAMHRCSNELLLINYRNFYFWVGDSSSGYTSVSANDGKWHHICVTWENTAGSWNFYKDGKVAASGKGLKTGYVIRGGGALVLGQEQDSVGGSFSSSQSFIGEMTGVNIWDHVIKGQEIFRMSNSCLTGVGNVFQWSDFKAHLKGSVQIIKPSC